MDDILNRLIENFPFPVALVNERNEILNCNGRFLDLSGKRRKDILEKPVLRFLEKCGNLGEGTTINRSSIPGKNPLFQTENAKGEKVFLKIDEIEIEDKGIKRKIIILRDVSEVISLRDENQHLSRLASVGELYSFVLHDIGNIVSVIKGCAEIAASSKGDSKGHRFAEEIRKIRKESERIEEIVGRLLGFTRKGDNNLEFLSAFDLIEDTLSLKKYSLKKKGIKSKIKVEGKKEWIIAGNKTLLLQVFLNLIDNAEAALDDCDEKKLEISLKRNGKDILIDIVDSGMGIPETNQDKIFDTFYTTKKKGTGTGLGLSICKRIVHKHGGDLFLHESRPGRGSRFRVRLPAAEGSALKKRKYVLESLEENIPAS